MDSSREGSTTGTADDSISDNGMEINQDSCESPNTENKQTHHLDPKTEEKSTNDDNSKHSDSIEEDSSDEKIEDMSVKEKELEDEDDGKVQSMDILGNGLLMKQVLKCGNGLSTRPVGGQVVTLKCVSFLDEENKQFEEFESLQFELAEGDVIQALDLCVALMEYGEVCTLITDARYAYGDLGRKPDVPGGARLRYELELFKVEDSPDVQIMDTMERVHRANKKRERGNELYLRGDYSSAINSYTRALTILDDDDDEVGANKDEYKDIEELKLKCYNNLAACQIKLEAYEAALKSCSSVLNVEPNNVKALFRKGKVLANKGELEDALLEMRKAIKIEPANKIIHQELAKLVARYNEQMQSTKDMCKKMVGDMANMANVLEHQNATSKYRTFKFPASKLLLISVIISVGALVLSIAMAM